MITKILIANRGEIALRIIKTCNRLKIKTVAIASKSEIDHPHLKYADQAIILDCEYPADVYLNADLIIKTALENKVEAIHPGYGFLAENSDFANKINKAGLIFIGPSTETLELLGDKSKTRILAIKNKVPVINGYNQEDQSYETLHKEAKKIGFPIMLKAVMGGGGRGMRKVSTEKDFKQELESAKKEAQRLYANTDICIEKFIENPRHIEVQVAGDNHGNHIHFFERDCSIQRRFQKVIEFAPANIEEKTLNNLYKHAITIAKASKLSGLATMEFLVSNQDIYFLEANPRIQVEHPVTETICATDLVELQIKIANNESIAKIKPEKSGFALEARIYAENPEKEFISTSGFVRQSNLPSFDQSFSTNQNIRFDHALFKNYEANQHFDPMLCKAIISAKNHKELCSISVHVLEQINILGIETNIQLLISLLSDPNFLRYNAQDLEKFKFNFASNEIAILCLHASYPTDNIFSKNWRNNGITRIDSGNYYIDNLEYKISKIEGKSYTINKKTFSVNKTTNNKITINNANYTFEILSPNHSNSTEIKVNGKYFLITKIKTKQTELQNLDGTLSSPLPGKITKIHTKKGEQVKIGDNLISIESMKIEHNIKCTLETATIEEIYVEELELVSLNQKLLKIKKR